MVGSDVFSIEIVPSKRGTNSLGFRGYRVPFPEAQMFVGQRKLEKVGENGDQEKSFIFMALGRPSTNLDSTVPGGVCPTKFTQICIHQKQRMGSVFQLFILKPNPCIYSSECRNFEQHAFKQQEKIERKESLVVCSSHRGLDIPSIHGKYYEIAELMVIPT